MRTLVGIKEVNPFELYDITVEDDHCFELENGVIAHNSKAVVSGGTWITYAADTVIIFGKQQEKEGTELLGFNFILNIDKSRFVREKSKLPLEVRFDGGISKYSGILELAEESGLVIKPKNGRYALVDKETGEIIPENGVKIDKTQTDEFLGKVISNPEFQEFIRSKYKLSRDKTEISEDIDSVIDNIIADEEL